MPDLTWCGCGEGPDNIDIKVWAWLGRDLGYELPCRDPWLSLFDLWCHN